jgi:predicted Holliday junction resolvase-like endonuclease
MNPKVISLAFMLFSFVDFFLLTLYCITFLLAVALNKALARVASLEAKLKTTSQALKDANAAKASAEKAAKTAEAKAKKAEKALVEVADTSKTYLLSRTLLLLFLL